LDNILLVIRKLIASCDNFSVDLDLFSPSPFDETALAYHLQTKYAFHLDHQSQHTLKGEIQGVQIDCITHQYPWLTEYITDGNVRLASLHDIAAMKLNAISGNGTRIKDFIDVAYLSTTISLNDMLDAYARKYKANRIIPLKSLFYWRNIHFEEPVNMIHSNSFDWECIAKRLNEMQEHPQRIFPRIIMS
jgi:hypothetical protein